MVEDYLPTGGGGWMMIFCLLSPNSNFSWSFTFKRVLKRVSFRMSCRYRLKNLLACWNEHQDIFVIFCLIFGLLEFVCIRLLT